jgi:hypothetical protein
MKSGKMSKLSLALTYPKLTCALKSIKPSHWQHLTLLKDSLIVGTLNELTYILQRLRIGGMEKLYYWKHAVTNTFNVTLITSEIVQSLSMLFFNTC